MAVIVNNIKTSLCYDRYKRLQKAVISSDEDHALFQIEVHFYRLHLPFILRYFSKVFKSVGNTLDGPNVLPYSPWKKNNLYPASIMDSIGVQLYGLVISTQESSFSQCNASLWHDMNFLCSLEGGSTPDHYGTSSTVSCNKCIRCEILIVPVTLDVFWAIENLLPHFSVLCLALLSKV